MQSQLNIAVVTPVFNDWDSLTVLVDRLQSLQVLDTFHIVQLLVVDDGSSVPFRRDALKAKFPISIIELNANMGHQRAISIGLSYAEAHLKTVDHVVVMDCDGEDRPEDIYTLLKTQNERPEQGIQQTIRPPYGQQGRAYQQKYCLSEPKE